MPSPLFSRASIADLDRRAFVGLLGGIVGLGLALQVFLVTNTTAWTIELERLITLVSVIVAIVVYVRTRPTARAWEIGVLAVWGAIVQWLVSLVWFIVGPALAGEVSVSAILLSGAAELRLAEVGRYLGTVAVFAGFYTVAASHREQPIISVLTLLSVPVVMIVVYAII
ncbi:hypothetical protein [Halorubrum sp. DM2]|uniref:hypothetical protein n=1 Tax=Halorubrum sp. DM2 TaxID=2527867 RepID=UPI0024B67E61|nr:hypothetical protein [Halorubrum sp. DM2]